jgi:phosphate transport system substrate-binding protein
MHPPASTALRRRLALAGGAAAALGVMRPGAALANEVTGAGSSFAYPIITRWGHRFTNIEGEGGGNTNVDGGMDYEPSGSGAAVARLRQRAGVDFGATDVSMPPEELERLGLVQFPFVSGGISIIVSLRGVGTGQLRLTGPLLARIFMAEITDWSHPDIAALNPGLAIPAGPITVVHRADGSGTTWNTAAYLGSVSPAWREAMGMDWVLRWRAGVGVRGNRQVVERVAATPGAIGYAETGLAERARLAAVLVQNPGGQFVAPAPRNLAEALATVNWDATRQFHSPYQPPQGAGAYPLTATVYALMLRRPASRGRFTRTLTFFRRGLSEGAEDAAALGYVPLPDAAVRQVFAHWQSAWR